MVPRSDGQNNQSMGWSCRTDGSGDMLAHQLRWQQQQQPFAFNMVLDAAFCGSRATVCVSGGLEMRKVSLSGGRAGRVMIFLARSILARGHPDRTRHAIVGTMETDVGAQTTWLLESIQCIWEVVVGSGGGGGDRLSSEKLAEVGRGDGWAGVNRPDAGMGR